MKVVIAGCRNYDDYDEAKSFIDYCLVDFAEKRSITILSGGVRGADAIGERYAKEKGFSVEKYPADWKTCGKSAGPMRNRTMAKKCDLVICFWDGQSKGTKSMIDYAKKYNKPIMIKKILVGDYVHDVP